MGPNAASLPLRPVCSLLRHQQSECINLGESHYVCDRLNPQVL